ncbi:MAG: hypothetical protein KDJ90_24220, partial [Nitratireductor sp.]|nr:hypothetical protein [Nitratireductor sp.]
MRKDAGSSPFALSRRQFFVAFAAAAAAAKLSTAGAQTPIAGDDADAVAATHAALFDLWFPLADLGLPPDVEPGIAEIATQVSAGMLQAFSQS